MQNYFGEIKSNLFRNKHLLQHAATEGWDGEEGLVCGRFLKTVVKTPPPPSKKNHAGMWLPASALGQGYLDIFVGGPLV